jgi:transposase-like protein
MEHAMNSEPKSLQEAILYFSDPDRCIEYLAIRRWPDGVVICPNCGSDSVSAFNKTRRTWKCSSHHAKREFSIKVGTMMEDSAIGLDKWLAATWLLTNCKNGISSYEIARALKVTQKTAWFMMHRIRLTMKPDSTGKIGGGEVEVDETFVGGKAENRHNARRLRLNQIRGLQVRGDVRPGKTAVQGILDRENREIRAFVIPNVRRDTLQSAVLEQVEYGSKVYTDQAQAYAGLIDKFAHEVVNHMEAYVQGRVHTNGLENFWSLLKRGLNGTYVAVEPFHLFRYVDEQVFRYNNRKTAKRNMNDADRFNLAIKNITGKRLTFAEVTGKVGETIN